MEFQSIAEAARFGMTYERSRVEAASQNLALANVAYSNAAQASQAAEQIQTNLFNSLLSASGSDSNGNTLASSQLLSKQSSGVTTVHDPSHPLANSQGEVFFADIDPVREMATLVSAVRAYEANIRAYNTNGEMNQAALGIGGSR
ncbi:MAG: flagellar biosynthesis protein FlgC [Alteromonadaceae bacterium]|nr:MAG: flagellar biosynthesis protein FlgC [Alteromonadaceae bacterium]